MLEIDMNDIIYIDMLEVAIENGLLSILDKTTNEHTLIRKEAIIGIKKSKDNISINLTDGTKFNIKWNKTLWWTLRMWIN